jgi:PAS domain S-box-containing protein
VPDAGPDRGADVTTARRLSLAFGMLAIIVCASALVGLRALTNASDAIDDLSATGDGTSSAATEVSRVRTDLSQARGGIVAALVLGVVVAAAGSVAVRRRLGSPVDNLLAGIERIKSGDLNHRIPSHRRDEFADIATSINGVIDQRQRVHQELALLKRRDELVLASVGEGILALDADGRVTAANPAAAAMLGEGVDELVGQHHHDLANDPGHGDGSHSQSRQAIDHTLADGQVRYVESDVFWRKDGSSFSVEYTCTPILEEGRSYGAVILFRDVTERRAVERMKEEFVSIVSHELRTPLTSIRGSLGLIASGMLGDVPERGQRMLDIAITNSDRLVRLINDILDIEKLDSGAVKMNLQPSNAADLMTQATETMRALANESGVSLAVTPAWAQLNVDPDRILQALTNLLSNAIKFSDWGGRVWMSAERHGNKIVFEVNDQGRGIPPHRLETIFERFQQVDASDAREKGGTGLGLSICRSIVEQHGGRIWAESTPGKGSTFRFSLPISGENSISSANGESSNDGEAAGTGPATASNPLEGYVR